MQTNEILPCGCIEGACYCDLYPSREELNAMEISRLEAAVETVIEELTERPHFDRYPTLSERLAESIKDDRRAA